MAKNRIPPSGRVTEVPQVGANPTGVVEQMGRMLERGRDFIAEGQEPPGRGSGPRNRSFALRRRDMGPQPKWKPLRFIGAGSALAIANPFGWEGLNINPIIAPLFPAGFFGRDLGLICHTSVCAPLAGPFYVKASNICTPTRTPQCPFGSVALVPGTYWNTYKEAVDAEFSGNTIAFPYAHILYIKGGVGPGYYVHEVQLVQQGYDLGMRLAPLLLPASQLAIGFVSPNPNLLGNQMPDAKHDINTPAPKLDPKTETRLGRSVRTKIFTMSGVKSRPPTTAYAPIGVPRAKRETKLQFSSFAAYRVVMAAIDAYTESQDFIRAIYGAIPCKHRVGEWRSGPKGGKFFRPGGAKCHRFDTQCQARALDKHFNEINWDAALLNVVANQYEDAVIGMQNKFLADTMGARKSWNRYAQFKGLQRDMRALQENAHAAQRRLGTGKGGCR